MKVYYVINKNNILFFQQYRVENLMNVLCCQLNFPASYLVFQVQGKGMKRVDRQLRMSTFFLFIVLAFFCLLIA